MDSSKGVTDIGFDRATELFTTSEEWWENLKLTNKLAYKLKTKPLEHEDLIREVFTGATATGKHHWTPSEQVADIADGESDSINSLRLQPFTEPYRPVRKKGGSTSGKLKKISSGISVLADSFNHLSVIVRSQKHLAVRHGTGASQKYGIETYM
ncbi:hypothetical protein ACSBR1_024165 [Camellia fascicularis]